MPCGRNRRRSCAVPGRGAGGRGRGRDACPRRPAALRGEHRDRRRVRLHRDTDHAGLGDDRRPLRIAHRLAHPGHGAEADRASPPGALTGGMGPTPIGLPPQSYDVKLNSVHADGTGAEDHAVSQVVVDSDYLVTNGTGNDVTLLKLDRPAAVAPVRIAAAGERHIWDPGTKATIAGFGLTSQDASQPPPTMMRAQVPIQSDGDCARAYPNGLGAAANGGSFDPKSMLCAGYPQGGTDTCQGDSGGPLLAKALDGSLRLV